MPELSILIVNWNTRDLLRECLLSLEAHPYREDDEIIVVDNASTDGSAAMVREEFASVTLIEPGRNAGYAAGNNLAFARASSELLLTLNPDTRVLEGTLEMAAGRLRSDSQAGYLGVQLVSPDGSVQQSVRGFPNLLGLIGDFTGLGGRLGGAWDSYRLMRFDYTSAQGADQPMGTFLLFRREALAAVGDPKRPFDEAFPIFFNEVDLLKRLSDAGWHGLYEPNARLVHHHGASTRQVRKSMVWESHKSLVRYAHKHWPQPVLKPVLWLFALLIYLAAFIRARGYHVGFRP